MTGFPNSPKLIRAGLVLISPDNGSVERIITLQYAPETLSRQLEAQAIEDGGDRSQPLRLTGPAKETITLEAEIDATDQLEFPAQNTIITESGIFPALSALETMVYPSSAQLERQNAQAAAGSFEIAPAETPLALFVWSARRIVPVRLDSLQITEEFFDHNLNPIRAKVSLSLRVLSVDDLGFGHRGSGLFMAYLQSKEQLSAKFAGGTLDALGAGRLA
ncbi:hypothetical protein [Billgrantia montanilacus]|uniref:Uncharacterized protein n=1 Tax=Billgrantia montanilacus TaxID=2282305 RepID=A0A368TXR4_9GAMM|nr:hypothetical protein [Halomonas montanilacus]RCV89156.1 hypothetical protein DU505_11405 [Halomonas montanilacus]